MKTRLLVLGSLLGVFAIGALGQAPPPFVGTWKLNVAKSRYSPGPPPKSHTVTHQAIENGMKQVTDGIDSEGKPWHSEWTAKFDGKDYPISGGEPGAMISLTKVDDHTTAWTVKVGARVAESGRVVYSRDGKLRTLTWTGTNAKGQKVDNTTVYERQ